MPNIPTFASSVRVYMEAQSVSENQVLVPIKLQSGVSSVAGIEIHIHYNSADLELLSIESESLKGALLGHEKSGEINIIWDDFATPLQFIESEEIVEMKFKVLTSLTKDSRISFLDTSNLFQFDGDLLATSFSGVTLKIGSQEGSSETEQPSESEPVASVPSNPAPSNPAPSNSGGSSGSPSSTIPKVEKPISEPVVDDKKKEKPQKVKKETPAKNPVSSPLDNKKPKPSLAPEKDYEGDLFVDVEDHWAKEYILKLAEDDILKHQKYFKPDDTLKRAEFSKIIIESFDLGKDPLSADSYFKDIQNTDWFFPYIQSLYELQIIKGRGNNNFLPGDTVKQVEALKIVLLASHHKSDLENYLKLYENNPPKYWYEPYLAYGIMNGLIKDSFAFKAGDNVTRAEMAEMIFLSR
ncbi:hypothetical protein HON22_01775 [Candidatus Peregrinibacteria bacterium]|nr:hypothetical protein [Candidatus Peregrinibacteria bacterium]